MQGIIISYLKKQLTIATLPIKYLKDTELIQEKACGSKLKLN